MATVLSIVLILAGCAKHPASKNIDGVKAAESTKDDAEHEQENEKVKMETEVVSVQNILQSFPTHISEEFLNQTNDNCLVVETDVVIPKEIEKLYSGEGHLKQWSQDDIEVLTRQLLEKGLISGEYSVQTYTDEQESDAVTSISYIDEKMYAQEKQGELEVNEEEVFDKQAEDFCAIWKENGISIVLKPYQYDKEAWDNCTYYICQAIEGVTMEADFPATGTNEIVRPGGKITFGGNGIVSFDIAGFIDIENKTECDGLVSANVIKTSLKKAVDHYEIVFSSQLKAVKLELVYLAKREDQKISVIPVWNVIFDTGSYYQYIEEHPDEVGITSMMNLCINATDGSIAYAM